jgi:hypothetical protein
VPVPGAHEVKHELLTGVTSQKGAVASAPPRAANHEHLAPNDPPYTSPFALAAAVRSRRGACTFGAGSVAWPGTAVEALDVAVQASEVVRELGCFRGCPADQQSGQAVQVLDAVTVESALAFGGDGEPAGDTSLRAASILVGFAMYAQSLVVPQLLQPPEATGYGLGQIAMLIGCGVGLAAAVLAALIPARAGTQPEPALSLPPATEAATRA